MNKPRLFPPVTLLLIAATVSLPVGAGLLYETDFEGFNAGPDQWVGTEGWEGNDTGLGVHGIDQDAIADSGLGKSAFIGYAQPQSTLVSVSKPFHYDPDPSQNPVIVIDTIVGIEDSVTKLQRDSFFVSILNSDGDFLAAIHFANQAVSYGIWREDGVLVHDTGSLFFRGELHHLYLTIDLPANRWSAELDGIPLFTNALFTATGSPVNFGRLAYEWQLTASNPTAYGDNWMLIADLIVSTTPQPTFSLMLARESGSAILSWPAEAGCDYRVEYSPGLDQWFSNLPASSFPGITSNQVLSYSEPVSEQNRFYRIVRDYTP